VAILSMSQRVAALLVGAAFSATLTMAQQPTPRPATPPPFEQVYKMPLVYSVPSEDQVQDL